MQNSGGVTSAKGSGAEVWTGGYAAVRLRQSETRYTLEQNLHRKPTSEFAGDSVMGSEGWRSAHREANRRATRDSGTRVGLYNLFIF
jgi:hypothetical protein